MQKDIESWCQWFTICGKCKAVVWGHGQLQQPIYRALNEKVSVDLMGPFKLTQNGNDYIVVMQDWRVEQFVVRKHSDREKELPQHL